MRIAKWMTGFFFAYILYSNKKKIKDIFFSNAGGGEGYFKEIL